MKHIWPCKFDCIALLSLAFLVAALHHSALSGSWRWDDGMHLLHTTQYSWNSVFLEFDVLRSVSGNQFAPWNLFLYYVNKALFGADVAWYYAHHLASLWAAAAGLYILLRQWLPAPRAWVAPALLLAGVPTFQLAQQLMVGHYLDGLVFASMGLVMQVRAVKSWATSRGKALTLSCAGALFYGLACLCKEIYVPWILMWLVLPLTFKTSLRRAVVCAAPSLLIALAYTVARIKLFSGVGDYYGGGANSWEATPIAQSLAYVPGALLGEGMRGAAAISLLILSLLAARRYSPAWCLVSSAALLVTGLPLVFLAGSNPAWELHARYLWAPWLVVCLVWAVPWRETLQRIQWVACLAFVGLVAWQVTILRPGDVQREALFDAHSRMALQPPPGVTHWVPAEFNGPAYVTFVTHAAHEALRRMGETAGPPPRIIRSIPGNQADQAAVQVWDAQCHCFRPLATLTSAEQTAALTRVLSDKGMLLPGKHPMADAYQGPTPEMRVEGKQLHVSGTAGSEGAGHVMILAGWAPSRLMSSTVTAQAHSKNTAAKGMKFEIVLEAHDATAAHQTRDRLCLLMQSQTQPYTFVALDAAAPSSACRDLLTPWALRPPAAAQH